MGSIIKKIKPESSPLVQNKDGKYAWLIYDDVYRIRLHICGKDFADTCNSKDDMPIVAQGFLVYCIIEKRFKIYEKIQLYVKYKKELAYNIDCRFYIDLLKEERMFYKQIKQHLFEWLPVQDIKAIKQYWKEFMLKLINLIIKNLWIKI